MKPFDLYIGFPAGSEHLPRNYRHGGITGQLTSKGVMMRDYFASLLMEIQVHAAQHAWNGRPLRSIFFGGGPPVVFYRQYFARIISALRDSFPCDDGLEISLECTPASDFARLPGELHDAGINRISYMAFALGQRTLAALGCRHSHDDTVRAVQRARASGLDKVALSIIFGVPGQSLDDFRADLRTIVELNPSELSFYQHRSAPGNGAARPARRMWRIREKIVPIDILERTRRALNGSLDCLGYTNYQLSSFAKDGMAPRYDLGNWNSGDFLGIGVGAASKFTSPEGKRVVSVNFSDAHSYVTRVRCGLNGERARQVLPVRDQVVDFVSHALSHSPGIRIVDLERKFGLNMQEQNPGLISALVDSDYMKLDGEYITLTDKGALVVDNIVASFVSDAA